MPRILITNDDGIAAPGLLALERALAALGEVYAVAPACEMSASSHSISLRRPVAFREAGERRWGVEGTPADAVIVALHKLLDFRPDLVVSGINPGGNLGRNVHYSGTVAAAVEGALHDIPAMAVSLCGPPFDFDMAGSVAARIARLLLGAGLGVSAEPSLSAGFVLNVNIPAGASEGIRLTRVGRSAAEHVLHLRAGSSNGGENSGSGARPQAGLSDAPSDHRLTHHGAAWRPLLTPDSDYAAVRDGFVSITPLALDRTDSSQLAALELALAALLTP